MPDHATPSKLKTHSNEPVPFAILTKEALNGRVKPARRGYTEADAKRAGIVVSEGYRLIDALFGAELPADPG
jgi:2,3-bisphosphoglycerate-independent phosphoglycerate mutase